MTDKRLQARVKSDSLILVVTAFGGRTFTQADWSFVPAGSETEAEGHPYLETRTFKDSASQESAKPKAPARKRAPAKPKTPAAKPTPVGPVGDEGSARGSE